jgi:hypothetical protein
MNLVFSICCQNFDPGWVLCPVFFYNYRYLKVHYSFVTFPERSEILTGELNTRYIIAIVGSVAEPEPVERPLFSGAGAQVFRPGSGSRSGYVNSYKMLQKVLNFSYII